MDALLSGKMKRKDLEDVSDEFSEFSLSAPARKIRRLHVELPPIMEVDEPLVNPVSNSQLPERNIQGGHEGIISRGMEEIPSSYVNEERALVLYKPLSATPLLQSPNLSNMSLKVNVDLIPRLQDQSIWLKHEKDVSESAEKAAPINNSLAVVPWVPSNFQLGTKEQSDVIDINSDPMDADEELTSMEIEDTGYGGVETNSVLVNAFSGAGDLRQQEWQRQHCMMPNIPPPNSSTPLTWS